MIKINDEIIGYRGNIGKVIEIEDDVVYILVNYRQLKQAVSCRVFYDVAFRYLG